MAQRYRAVPTTPGTARESGIHDTSIDVPNSPSNHRGRRFRDNASVGSPEPLRPQVPPSVMASTPNSARQRPRSSPAFSIQDQQSSTRNSTPTSFQGASGDETGNSKRPFSFGQNPLQRKGTVVLHPMQAEPDDYLHIPDKNPNARSRAPTWRGCINVLTLTIIILALLMLFIGYPLLTHFRDRKNNEDVKNPLLAKHETEQIPIRGLVDKDTPKDARTRKSPHDNSTYELVFSDEFETPGRTFWPGDDPFWEAVDVWYGATFDYEWYTPEGAYTKKHGDKGVLELKLEEQIERKQYFRSGMIQSWNKFCFQGGYIEAAIQFPGGPKTKGYWPGFWLMGNLGRPGYLASADGMWPYVYEECDVGILKNQTYPDGKTPQAALHGGEKQGNTRKYISGLPGMRFPSCTCKGEDHPGPHHGIARSAPELDICELQVQSVKGNSGSAASQSYQIAPFNYKYGWDKNSSAYHIYDNDTSAKNVWKGSDTQEALSVTTHIDDSAFELEDDATYTRLGVEYEPDWDDNGGGYITFYANGKPSWTIYPGALAADPETEIGRRTFPKEPMSIILNLGIADGFQKISTSFSYGKFYLYSLEWREQSPVPGKNESGLCGMYGNLMQRVYQREGTPDSRKSCDPPDHPTKDYIQRHLDLYMNNNITHFEEGHYKGKKNTWPKNRMNGGC